MSCLKQGKAVPPAAAEDRGGNKANPNQHRHPPRSHGYRVPQSNRGSAAQSIPGCGAEPPPALLQDRGPPCTPNMAGVPPAPPTPAIPPGHGSTGPWDVPPWALGNASPDGTPNDGHPGVGQRCRGSPRLWGSRGEKRSLNPPWLCPQGKRESWRSGNASPLAQRQSKHRNALKLSING